jgi:hypothetical protein
MDKRERGERESQHRGNAPWQPRALRGGGERICRLRGVIELDPHSRRRIETAFGIFLEAAVQHATNVERQCDGQRRPIWILADHRDDCVGCIVTRERAFPSEHLKQHRTQCPDVRAPIDELPSGLLRRHVRCRAQNDACLRGVNRQRRRVHRADVRSGIGIDCFREAEVQHFHGAISTQFDVCRLEIAVNDAVIVCGLKSLPDLPRDRQRFIDWHRATRDALREIFTFDELHYEGGHTTRFFQSMNVRDVWVIERREHPRFAPETREAIGIARDCRQQHLNRDIAIQLQVAGTIHLAHSTRANGGNDLVWADQGAGSDCHDFVIDNPSSKFTIQMSPLAVP